MREFAGVKPISEMKVSIRCALRINIDRFRSFEMNVRKSVFVRTREMVNYT